MITQGDIAKILVMDCKALGLPVYQMGNTPEGKVTKERVVVIPKKGSLDTYWEKCYVEVNLCAPDKNGLADIPRLDELERRAVSLLKSSCGVYDETRYRYSKDSTSREQDTELGCHYVNVRLLFEILNV